MLVFINYYINLFVRVCNLRNILSLQSM